MNIYLLLTLLLGFCLIYIWIGQRASLNTKNNQDYFLMGRKLTFLPLCMTFFATMLGGGTLIGSAQSAYSIGWLVILYPIGNSAGFIVLATGFGQRLRQLNLTTIPQIFESIYSSPILRKISALIMTASLYFILVGQGVAIKSFFVTIGLSNIFVFTTFWICFVAYTTLGGFEAVVRTDVIQAIFIIIGLIIALISTETSIPQTFSAPEFTPSEVPWVSWLLMPLCYTLIGQDMGQRCFASENDKIIAPAAIGASILVILCSSIAIYFGVLAQSSALVISTSENVLITAVNSLTPGWVGMLCSAVIIMAVASTSDSLLCAISACLCYDLKTQTQSKLTTVTRSRITTFLIGSSSLLFILLFDDVVSLLIFSYELSISVLFVPIAIAIYSPTASKNAAGASMIVGGLLFILFKAFPVSLPTEILTLSLSYISYLTTNKWQH